METKQKHSIKIITLYDLCSNNYILLISTVHHIIILIFNYYAIIHLQLLQSQFNKFQINFELIQHNIEVCQSLTFITAFFVTYFSQPLSENNIEKNNHLSIIMTISFLSKMIYTLYQVYMSKDTYIKCNDEDYISFGEFYNFIQLSYIIRLALFMSIIIGSTGIYITLICEKVIPKFIEWSKNYKIKFIQKKNNDGSEDV